MQLFDQYRWIVHALLPLAFLGLIAFSVDISFPNEFSDY